MSRPVTAVRPQTFERLQLDAGAFVKNFDVSTYTEYDALEEALFAAIKDGTKTLGATRGGGTFTATPTIRNREADGKRYEFKGSTVIDFWDIKLTTTLMEITPDNFTLALGTAEKTEDKSFTTGKKTTIKLRTNIEDSDYIQNLVWFGNTSKGLVAIALDNALNNTGVTLTFSDKGEGTIPVEFHAYQDTVENNEYAPCTIYYFDKAAQ
jgi:hypothetical protein